MEQFPFAGGAKMLAYCFAVQYGNEMASIVWKFINVLETKWTIERNFLLDYKFTESV